MKKNLIAEFIKDIFAEHWAATIIIGISMVVLSLAIALV